MKQEPVERANLIKALEENLKAVVETQQSDSEAEKEDQEDVEKKKDEEEEHDEEAENEEEPDDDEEISKETEVRVKKEPKASKIIRQSQLAALAAQQPSYIMKLFDRSVNLAQFEEDTPLYPLCRSWMKNQPRGLPPKFEKSNDPVDVQHVEDGDVVEMPRVRIRKGKTPARSEVRINKKDFDKQIDAEVWTKKKLLNEHRTHWKAEKIRHIQTAQAFEEKHFAANLELLESLIKESEE